MGITSALPAIQAGLNVTAACLLVAAFYHIRNGNKQAHKAYMLGALLVSALFLTSYFYYHATVGYVPFTGQGFVRPVYFSILFSHILSAALLVPLVLVTVTLALKGKFTIHRRLAKWAWPAWIFVSVTGVVVYLMAFQIFPA